MFGGSSTAPDTVAYSDTGGQLAQGGADGFARTVVPGDKAGGRYVSNLVDLTVGQAPVPAKGPGGLSTQFTLSGVKTPGVYTLSSLETLPAVQLKATYKAGGNPVTDTYTGVWTLLNQAGLITDPTSRTMSCGNMSKRSAAMAMRRFFRLARPTLCLAIRRTWWPMPIQAANLAGMRGRVCADRRAGRRHGRTLYISNLVALKVFTAAPVPEPATWMLLIGPLPILAFLRSRRRTFASGQAGGALTKFGADTASE